jgi:hypothetical protein
VVPDDRSVTQLNSNVADTVINVTIRLSKEKREEYGLE